MSARTPTCASACTFDTASCVGPRCGYNTAERDGTVAFLNDSNTTKELLDIDCGLYSSAAKWLIKSRPFADMYAAADTKNVGVSNLSWSVDCARDQGYIAASTTETIENFNNLDANLQNLVSALLVDAQQQADDACSANPEWCYSGTFDFWGAVVTTTAGSFAGATIEIGRIIDPDGGVAEYVTYTIDADYNVTDAFWDGG